MGFHDLPNRSEAGILQPVPQLSGDCQVLSLPGAERSLFDQRWVQIGLNQEGATPNLLNVVWSLAFVVLFFGN